VRNRKKTRWNFQRFLLPRTGNHRALVSCQPAAIWRLPCAVVVLAFTKVSQRSETAVTNDSVTHTDTLESFRLSKVTFERKVFLADRSRIYTDPHAKTEDPFSTVVAAVLQNLRAAVCPTSWDFMQTTCHLAVCHQPSIQKRVLEDPF